ncbi:AMP-binding protein [Kytococcus sedentarius]|uniref:AMP-binding protein n=1 Tax=Kytococcus sedentarius TaxID=1276 RepID=UPI0035BC7CAE
MMLPHHVGDRDERRAQARILFTSGGTTGRPAVTELAMDEMLVNCAWHGQGYRAAGIGPDDTVAVWGVPGLMTSEFTVYLAAQETGARVLPIGVGLDAEAILTMLDQFEATVLLVMPSNLHPVVSHCLETGRRLDSVRLCVTGGEPMLPADADRLQSVCTQELTFRQVFQTSEVGSVGYQCEACPPGTFHVHEGYQEVEIAEPDDQGIGSLLVTNRARRLHPVVRQEVGDRAAWVPGPCPCGDTSARFALHGRLGKLFLFGAEKVDQSRFPQVRDELGLPGDDFTVVLRRSADGRDELLVRSTTLAQDQDAWARAVQILRTVHPKMGHLLDHGVVAPLRAEPLDGATLGNSGKTRYFENERD